MQGAKAPGYDPRKRRLFVLFPLFPPFMYLAIGMFEFNVLFCEEIQVFKKYIHEWKFFKKSGLLTSVPWGSFTKCTGIISL